MLFSRCPEVVGLLPSILKGWDIRKAAHPERPIISVVAMRGGYRIAAPWLAEGMRVGTPVAAICRLVVDLMLAWIEADRSLLCLHCGAARIGGRLAVFPNTYRAGKSTMVAALAALGVRAYADDVLPLDAAGNGIATGIAPRLRLPLPPAVARHFAGLAVHAGPADDRYLYLDLPRRLIARRGETAPIGAFVLLERDAGASPRLMAVESAEMLRHVVPRNFAEGPGAADVLERLSGLVARVPCLALRYDGVGPGAALLLRSLSGDMPRLERREADARPAPPGSRTRVPHDRRFVARRGIAMRRVGTDAFLADTRSGAIHALNPVGAAIWGLLDRPTSAAQAAEAIAAAFPDRDARAIAGDVAALFHDLSRSGAIVPA